MILLQILELFYTMLGFFAHNEVYSADTAQIPIDCNSLSKRFSSV